MKASYEALQQLTQGSDLGLLTTSQTVALPSDIREVAANTVVVATTTQSSTKKQKKYYPFSLFKFFIFLNVNTTWHTLCRKKEVVVEQVAAAAVSPMEGLVDETVEAGDWIEGEWAPDPDEPRYCLCNQVSYGDMVACDNPEVSATIVRSECLIIDTTNHS